MNKNGECLTSFKDLGISLDNQNETSCYIGAICRRQGTNNGVSVVLKISESNIDLSFIRPSSATVTAVLSPPVGITFA